MPMLCVSVNVVSVRANVVCVSECCECACLCCVSVNVVSGGGGLCCVCQ